MIVMSGRLKKKLFTNCSPLPGNRIEETRFPNTRVLLTVGCTLPVSTAEAESVTY